MVEGNLEYFLDGGGVGGILGVIYREVDGDRDGKVERTEFTRVERMAETQWVG